MDGRDLDDSPDRPRLLRRRRVRLWLIISAASLFPLSALVMLGMGAHRVHQANHAADDLDARYRKVEPGMTMSEVRAVMGAPGAPQREPIAGRNFTMWDGEPLSPGDRDRVTGALIFKPSPVFTGVFVEITFDRDDKVVGKRRYD